MNRRTALKAIAALPMLVKGEIPAMANPLRWKAQITREPRCMRWVMLNGFREIVLFNSRGERMSPEFVEHLRMSVEFP